MPVRLHKSKKTGLCGYPITGASPCDTPVQLGKRCPIHEMAEKGHLSYGNSRGNSKRRAPLHLDAIAHMIMPPLCSGIRTSGKPCNAVVEHSKMVCKACWQDLLHNGTVAHRIEMTKEADLPYECALALADEKTSTVGVMFYMAHRASNSSEIWQLLASSQVPHIRQEVAKSPHCPPAIIQQLITDSNDLVKAQAIATMRKAQQMVEGDNVPQLKAYEQAELR